MAKFRSKVIEVQADIAIEPIEVRRKDDDCCESIRAGDAIVTVDGKSYGVRAPLFHALFDEAKEAPPKPKKG